MIGLFLIFFNRMFFDRFFIQDPNVVQITVQLVVVQAEPDNENIRNRKADEISFETVRSISAESR